MINSKLTEKDKGAADLTYKKSFTPITGLWIETSMIELMKETDGVTT